MHPSLYFTIYIEILFVSINIGKKFFKLALPFTCTLFVHPSLVEEQFLDVNYKSIFYILSFKNPNNGIDSQCISTEFKNTVNT